MSPLLLFSFVWLQKSRFSSLDACASEGVEITSIQHCYSSVELYGVNPREPLGGQPTAHDAVGQALCVVQKNTAIPVHVVTVFCHERGADDSCIFMLMYRKNSSNRRMWWQAVCSPHPMVKRHIPILRQKFPRYVCP